MRTQRTTLTAALASLFLAAAAPADTTVEIGDVHLCCGACVKGVASAVEKVPGAKAACDQDTGKVTLTAPDAATAQKAVDAIAHAGYHGKLEGTDAKFPETKGVPAGQVKSLKLGSIHNCCGSCNRAVVEAVESVDGVKANTAKPKQATFEVTGNFDAAKLIQALNAAGFHPTIEN